MSQPRETIRLLMVDDEEILYHGVRRVLDGLVVQVPEVGTEVVFEQSWVGSGEECLERIERETPDIIFLDYKLPGLSGLDVLNALRERQIESLVVMITAFASLETAVRATKLGAFDFLSKPFTPDEIRHVARKTASQLVLTRRARALEDERKLIRFEFLSVLSHELKAPLNAIEGYLDVLKERVAGDERHMVDRSLLRLDGMRKLIFDLLDLTRIESGQKHRVLITVDIMKILKATLETVASDARARGITLTLPPHDAFEVKADADEMEIIANNLITNAVKYNRDGGSVMVSLTRAGDEVTLAVTDTGIGLAPEEASKLFREFVRIRNEHTVRILGSGLGLSTVRKLAKLYGGDVSVASEPGKGSRFAVTWKDEAPGA